MLPGWGADATPFDGKARGTAGLLSYGDGTMAGLNVQGPDGASQFISADELADMGFAYEPADAEEGPTGAGHGAHNAATGAAHGAHNAATGAGGCGTGAATGDDEAAMLPGWGADATPFDGKSRGTAGLLSYGDGTVAGVNVQGPDGASQFIPADELADMGFAYEPAGAEEGPTGAGHGAHNAPTGAAHGAHNAGAGHGTHNAAVGTGHGTHSNGAGHGAHNEATGAHAGGAGTASGGHGTHAAGTGTAAAAHGGHGTGTTAPVHGNEVHQDADGGYSYLDTGADKVAVSFDDLAMLGFRYAPPDTADHGDDHGTGATTTGTATMAGAHGGHAAATAPAAGTGTTAPVHGNEVHQDTDGGYSYLDAGASKVAISFDDLALLGFRYTPPGMVNGPMVPGQHSHAA